MKDKIDELGGVGEMQKDFIGELGLAFLAHRLRRTSDSLIAALEPVFKEHELLVPARGASTMLLLSKEGPLWITDIAHRLRLSHPLIIRIAKRLQDAGYADSTTEANDRRARQLSLTPLGSAKVKELESLIAAISKGYASLFGDAAKTLPGLLDDCDDAIASGKLHALINKHYKA